MITTPTPTRIDELVVSKLNKLGIHQSELADDATFLRRVSLDITGTLPSPPEIRSFLNDSDPDKRAKKIDQLLDSPAYAAWWTTFFCDLTGNNTTQLRNLNVDSNRVSQRWYDWIYQRVDQNVPYDEMVEGIVVSNMRLEGEGLKEYCARMSQSFVNNDSGADEATMPYYWMRREFRDGETRAISFAHAFMGIRIQCAQCHKHPFDKWSKDDFQQFSRFFTGVSVRQPQQGTPDEKRVYAQMLKDIGIDRTKMRGGNLQRALNEALREGKTIPFVDLNVGKPRMSGKDLQKQRKKNGRGRSRYYSDAILLGSDIVDLSDLDDARQPVMDWLRSPDNPYFARALVNRVWQKYFGVGIVDPADDLNLANPPSNGPLLDYLATGFVENGYDLKWLHRAIATSRTYQLSWEPNESNKNDRHNFSRALPRRLPAEVVFDAVSQAASNQQVNHSFRENVAGRAISIPGTQIRRNNKNRQNGAFALQVFGRSQRANSCDCDRSDETSLMQTIYLQNDRDVHAILSSRAGWVGQMQAEAARKNLSEKDAKQLAQLRKQFVALSARKKRLLEQDNEAQAKKIQRQINRLKQRVEPINQRLAKGKAAFEESFDPEQIITEAYLRTLSRFPTEQELERCQSFIVEGESDIAKSVSGVLWALVNTKEFIVNH